METVTQKSTGFELLQEFFPEIEDEECLPDVVKNSANEKGTELLYEYLMFKNKQLNELNNELKERIGEFNETLGNQRDCSGGTNPLSEEFMRSLWD